MSDNDTFRMTYSAEEKDEIEKIRDKYTEKKPDDMTRLKALDKESESIATMVSIIAGVVGILVFGTGLSLYLSELGDALGEAVLPVSILVGLVGVILMVSAFPLYMHTLRKEREKRKDEILALADELLKKR